MNEPRHVLYFALRPPPDAVARAHGALERLRRRFGLTAAAVLPDRLHVSLNGLGRYERPPGALIERAVGAAETVRVRPFRIAFNRVGTWGRGAGARPLVLHGDEGVIGIEALHDALHGRLADAGLRRGPPRPFWPHMTLARDRAHAPEQVIPPIGWWTREFVLVHSLRGESRHEVLGRWTLEG